VFIAGVFMSVRFRLSALAVKIIIVLVLNASSLLMHCWPALLAEMNDCLAVIIGLIQKVVQFNCRYFSSVATDFIAWVSGFFFLLHPGDCKGVAARLCGR